MYQLQQKLKILKTSIQKWNKESFGNIFLAKVELDCKIKEVQNQGMQSVFSLEIREKEHFFLHEFSQREHQEEIYWSQKSRVKWLHEGERNTSFFHKSTIHHRQSNRLTRLRTEEGPIAESYEDMERTVNSFFSNLLEELDEDREASQREFLRHIPQVIMEEHNLLLMKPIEMEEVEEAVK